MFFSVCLERLCRSAFGGREPWSMGTDYVGGKGSKLVLVGKVVARRRRGKRVWPEGRAICLNVSRGGHGRQNAAGVSGPPPPCNPQSYYPCMDSLGSWSVHHCSVLILPCRISIRSAFTTEQETSHLSIRIHRAATHFIAPYIAPCAYSTRTDDTQSIAATSRLLSHHACSLVHLQSLRPPRLFTLRLNSPIDSTPPPLS